MQNLREIRRVRRHERIRKKISGNSDRPRLCVHRSLNHFYAQIIDDSKAKVLVGKSTLAKDLRGKVQSGGNVQAAKILGQAVAELAVQKGIKQVAFDRGGYLYLGRVKAFAEAAREGGLVF